MSNKTLIPKGAVATSRQRLSPPLKWHCSGGKHYLAERIVSLMPEHLHYVEPFAGGLSVLLAKPYEGVSEVVSDTNGWLTNFWAVLRDPVPFQHFIRFMYATPFSEALFAAAAEVLRRTPKPDGMDAVTAAAWFFICCRQSLAGRMKSFAPLSRTRVRRGMNEQASAWINAVDGLDVVHERLRRVVIVNRSAMEVIPAQDGPRTLFYCDPPYYHDTRTSPDAYGEHEMTHDHHDLLLSECLAAKGKVMISGYDCPLYSKRLADWSRHTFDLPNNAAGGAGKRRMTEVLWCNF